MKGLMFIWGPLVWCMAFSDRPLVSAWESAESSKSQKMDPGTSTDSPWCASQIENMSVQEVQGPLGIVATVLCNSMHKGSEPFSYSKELAKLSDHELLSLFSTELRQMQYIFHHEHREFMSQKSHDSVTERSNMAISFRLESESSGPQVDLTNSASRTFKTLSQNNVPVPPMGPPGSYFVNRDSFYVAKEYFVQPMAKSDENDVSVSWVELGNIPDWELLRFSPIMFLVIYQKDFEAWQLVYEFFCRTKDVSFLNNVRSSLQVVVDAYPMYFATTVDVQRRGSPYIRAGFFVRNLRIALHRIPFSTVFTSLLAFSDEDAVDEFVDKIAALTRSKAQLNNIYYNALLFSDEIENNVRVSTDKAIFQHFKHRYSTLTRNNEVRERIRQRTDNFVSMVLDTDSTPIKYVNVTF